MRRRLVGETGERLAASVLARSEMTVVCRNVRVGRGELDILALDGSERVVVEVRTITGPGEAHLAFDDSKRSQVRSLARRVGAARVDLVAIRLGPDAAEVRWVKGAA